MIRCAPVFTCNISLTTRQAYIARGTRIEISVFSPQRYQKGPSPHGIDRGHEQAVHIDKQGIKQRSTIRQSGPQKKTYATVASFLVIH